MKISNDAGGVCISFNPNDFAKTYGLDDSVFTVSPTLAKQMVKKLSAYLKQDDEKRSARHDAAVVKNRKLGQPCIHRGCLMCRSVDGKDVCYQAELYYKQCLNRRLERSKTQT